MKEHEWIEVGFYAKEAVKNTKSYSKAIEYVTKQCQIGDGTADVYSGTLFAVKTMYDRNGGLTLGKMYDKEKVTPEVTNPEK